MQNYIKALREYLEDDVEIQAYTSNIHWLRVPKEKDSRPLIIFTEGANVNPYNNQEGGWDIANVGIECVVDHKDSVSGREMRELLKKKLSSRSGAFYERPPNPTVQIRSWKIWYLEDVAVWYDEVNDVVSFGSIYKFKSVRDL